MAVLRGNGIAVQKDKTLRADVLTAHFKDKDAAPKTPKPAPKPTNAQKGGGDNDGLELEHADAYGHVLLTTSQETIIGDRGDYNMQTDIATVSGNVKITREGNELNGGYAHVDLNTGISKLFGGSPGGEGSKRVGGVFTPKKRESSDKTGSGEDEKGRSVFRGSAPSSHSPDSGTDQNSGTGGQ